MRQALRCGLLAIAATLGAGCTESGECVGEALSCDALLESECDGQAGCSSDLVCGGFATSCFTYSSQLGCELQSGCYWSMSFDRCSGAATMCTVIGSTSCALQDGCINESTCAGVADACATITGSGACAAQLGCAWQ